ncbi:hypothetical protein [Streptomyces lunaelactis]|uniref:hypothetical protein n=1 Tax=Streptomyces lunaelactis TaxID=1535768 RepID=UPI001584B567|nr:hypothetical protein [Streptomyces lunaelactis]NUK14065.1 hypothetical protein [Streptomyces lunaelactis]
MPSWISTILLAGATSLFIGLFITPRLEARNKRVRIAHEARDEFSRRVLIILSACGRLRESEVPPTLAEQRPALAEKMNAERQRWLDQLDEATRYLVDNMEAFGLGYATDRLRTVIGEFVAHARGVVLSERPVEKQVERLAALTGPIQSLFFVRRWRVATIIRSFEEFDRAVAALDEDLPDEPDAEPVPTLITAGDGEDRQ